MAKYLYKYIDKYRVLAEYDHSTNDYPRDHLGNLDSSFDDFYIPCQKGGKIIHVQGNKLMYFMPSNKICHNIARDIYSEKVGTILEDITTEQVYDELVKKDIIIGYEILTGETIIYFKDKNMEYIASKVCPKTNGCKIMPLSVKNLPKGRYEIPESDLKDYKDAIYGVDDMLKISYLNSEFNKIIQKNKGKSFNIKIETKKVMLKKKEFIHSIGMWDEYVKFLKKELSPS